MKRNFLLLLSLFLSFSIFIFSNKRTPKPTTWKSKFNKKKICMYNYKEGLILNELYKSFDFDSSNNRILLIFENNLYENLNNYVDLYFNDLEKSGYSLDVFEYVSGSPEELREFFKSFYFSFNSLKGVIFVGNLPYVVYEMYDSWDEWTYLNGYDDFPCDLFFMDMTGTWKDIGGCDGCEPNNGKYDKFEDEQNPAEIWVSRITPGYMEDYSEYVSLFNDYFKKEYEYRRGETLNSKKALDYVDDDWKWMTNDDKVKLGILFGFKNVDAPVEDVNGNICTAEDYKNNRMTYPYQMVYLRSHGSPINHGFYQNNKSEFKYVLIDDYLNIMPSSAFYLLYTCSGCDFSYRGSEGFLGGRVLFNKNGGLVSIGTTKTGGMWYDSTFFIDLYYEKSFGEAFVDWINDALSAYPEKGKPWWYGMTIIGDGTLSLFTNDGLCNGARHNLNSLMRLRYRLQDKILSGCFDYNGDGKLDNSDINFLENKLVNY